jgi:peptide/nickel transport system substrate-binding protein
MTREGGDGETGDSRGTLAMIAGARRLDRFELHTYEGGNDVKSRLSVLLSVVMLAGLLLSACGPAATPTEEPPTPPEATTPSEPEPSEPSSGIKRGGVLKFGLEVEAVDLDPAYGTAVAEYGHRYPLVYENLVNWDLRTLEPLPWLAESWEVSEDGLTWTFYLRQGVKWHNGEDLTAEDVAYSMNRAIDPDVGSYLAESFPFVESAEAVDSSTVVMNLSSPHGGLLDQLPSLYIVNEQWMEEHDGHAAREMMGTGPFMFVEWIPDEVITLESNPDYWRMGEDGQPLPYLDGVDLIPMEDEAARMTALETGEIDLTTVAQAYVEKFLDSSDIVMEGPESLWWAYPIGFNVTKPPFDNKLVREAICWAIDRDEIIDLVWFGYADPAYGTFIPDWHYLYSGVTKYDHQDLDKARDLLEQAGYAAGFDMTIAVGAPWEFDVGAAELAASHLAEIGINATVEPVEWGQFLEEGYQGKYEALSCGEILGGDRAVLYNLYFRTDAAWNWFFYGDPEMDAMIDEALTLSDPVEKRELFAEMDEKLLEDNPLCFTLLQGYSYEGLQPYVKGFVHSATTRTDSIAEVWLDK